MVLPLVIENTTPDAKTMDTPSTSSWQANSFSPPAQSVIYLFVSGTGASIATAQGVASITDDVGANLQWRLAVRDNVIIPSVLRGTAEIWWAYCPAAYSNMTLTVNLVTPNTATGSGNCGIIQPVIFTSAAPNQTGATAFRNSTASGTPSLSLTTTAPGSRVMCIVQNFSNSTTPTAGSSQTMAIISGQGNRFVANSGDGDGFWVQMMSSNTTNSGTLVTMNNTAPTGIIFHMAMVEILANQPMPLSWVRR